MNKYFRFLMFSFTWLVCGSTFAAEEKSWKKDNQSYEDRIIIEAKCRYEALELVTQTSKSASDMDDKFDKFGQELIKSCMESHGWRWGTQLGKKNIYFWGRRNSELGYFEAVSVEAECRYETLRLFAQNSEDASDMSDRYDEFGQKLIKSCMEAHGWREKVPYEYKDGYYQRSPLYDV